MDSENYTSFFTPAYIYVPYDDISKLKLRKNNVVYYGEELGKFKSDINIYSTSSGVVKGTSKLQFENNTVNTLVVENDYRDKPFKIIGGLDTINQFKRKQANDILALFNIKGKYNGKKYLVVDLTIKNNFLENKFFAFEYHYEILQTIDALISIYSLDKAYICVNDNVTKELLSRYIGMYPNIKYTNISRKGESYINYNGYEILKIYYALRYNKYLSEKFVTVINKNKSVVVKTKLYILVNELVSYLKIDNVTKISVITYENNKIEDYKGILTDNIKTIIIS